MSFAYANFSATNVTMAFFPLLSKRALLQGGNARAQLHVLRISEKAAVSMVSALVFERPGLKLSSGHGNGSYRP